jgi:hypothetical protein
MEITQQAKAWASFIAREVKVQEPDNPGLHFLIGETLLDKAAFNKLNTADNAVVHGLQVIYGPFQSLSDMRDYVSEYKMEWPGNNDWRHVKVGVPRIVTPYFEPGDVTIVHDASSEFQMQAGFNATQDKIREIEETKAKLKLEEIPKEATPDDIKNRIKITQERIDVIKQHLSDAEKFKAKLEKLLL